ncbi:MAG: hypothetical protein A2087_03280 [Spirochaetes bacterium GWD1_61_31]|nr:MAG: hypothetical protein A2Y37_05860 [Spirochaetes bacterium GWB1_60_80]OHD33786.1 MAG: hypothetical protein A2004_08805 [Spirochaetes bacterium GWC1_61_12]OHD35468.1 MAG: hypothetical protein A2087_03280 [Spirochaetes bacterium GWD1_61_31]OHD41533.1 MAG: hypothetical protein A2Y35_09640 [Spirochaetes bacterium GWE1_60_18]OHD61433.1 MAG: hypothetical protein A2Y32_09715 [Spirochaetes bacterium GWF1_60_12]HAP44793.1 hypothetical protein [Spirochaetaceae bacterium]
MNQKSPTRTLIFYTLGHAANAALVGAFEIAFLLRLFRSLASVLFLQLAMYLSLMLFFTLGLLTLRRGRAHIGFRLDLLFQALLAAWGIVFFTRLGSVAILAGYFLLRGASEGIFWATRHCALLVSVPDAERDGFFLRLQALLVALSVVLPLAGGGLIALPGILAGQSGAGSPLPPGYRYLFAAAGLISTTLLAISPRLEIPGQTFRPAAIFKAYRAPRLRLLAVYQSYASVHTIAASLCVSLLTFGLLQTETRLGVFTASLSALSAVAFWLIGRAIRGRPVSRLRWTLFGCAGEAIGRLGYGLFWSLPILFGKTVVDVFLSPLKSIFGENIVRRLLEQQRTRLQLSTAEGFFLQEFLIFCGRLLLLATGLAWAAGQSRPPVELARLILPFFSLTALGDFLFIRAMHNSLLRDPA